MGNFKSPRTATYPLLGITIGIFILQSISKLMYGDLFTNTFMLVPGDILVRPWILITSMFLHAGFAHLFFNMYVLLIFGPVLESRIGKKRFFWLYIGSGIISALGYSLISTTPALGASGAIMGMLGATIMLLPNLQVLFFFIIPMSLRTAGIIFAIIDLLGVFNPSSGIAHTAHLFGLAAGLIFGWYLIKKKKKFQTSFNTLKKYSEPIQKNKGKNKKHIIKDAQYSYSDSIKLTEEDINEYIRNGRL